MVRIVRGRRQIAARIRPVAAEAKRARTAGPATPTDAAEGTLHDPTQEPGSRPTEGTARPGD